MKRWLHDHSLSIALFALWVVLSVTGFVAGALFVRRRAAKGRRVAAKRAATSGEFRRRKDAPKYFAFTDDQPRLQLHHGPVAIERKFLVANDE
jgi:hypothetical protein